MSEIPGFPGFPGGEMKFQENSRGSRFSRNPNNPGTFRYIFLEFKNRLFRALTKKNTELFKAFGVFRVRFSNFRVVRVPWCQPPPHFRGGPGNFAQIFKGGT